MKNDFYSQIFEEDKPEKKSGINSYVKGAKNENNIIKFFMSIWTNEKFARSPKSGGLSWRHAVSTGDIVCITRLENFEFCVETKHYKNLGIDENVKTQNKKLRVNSCINKFWKQAKRDADSINKIPLLAVRQNRMKEGTYYIFFDMKISKIIKTNFFLFPILEGNNIQGFASEEIIKIEYKHLIQLI